MRNKSVYNILIFNFVIFFLSLFLSLIMINYLSVKSEKVLLPLAEEQTRKVIANAINKATLNINIDSEKLYKLIMDDKNEIKFIQYNSFEVTKLINLITNNIQKKIIEIENNKNNYYNDSAYSNGIIDEIPFGFIFDNVMLRNVGPKIKLHLQIYGDVISNIQTQVKPYGVNNAYLEVQVHLEVNARIFFPFVSKKVSIENTIPLSMSVVSGTVPEAIISSYK